MTTARLSSFWNQGDLGATANKAPEGAAFSELTFNADAPAVGFDGHFTERQAQTGPHAIVTIPDLAEFLENTLVIFRRNARTDIRDCYANLVLRCRDNQMHVAASRSVIEGIAEQVLQDAADQSNVACDQMRRFRFFESRRAVARKRLVCGQ